MNKQELTERIGTIPNFVRRDIAVKEEYISPANSFSWKEDEKFSTYLVLRKITG